MFPGIGFRIQVSLTCLLLSNECQANCRDRLIVVAVFALCVGHPGLFFSPKARTQPSTSSSDVEK